MVCHARVYLEEAVASGLGLVRNGIGILIGTLDLHGAGRDDAGLDGRLEHDELARPVELIRRREKIDGRANVLMRVRRELHWKLRLGHVPDELRRAEEAAAPPTDE